MNFETDTRGKYLELLGYNKEELASKVSFIAGDDAVNVTICYRGSEDAGVVAVAISRRPFVGLFCGE